jgi:hypothetical protein
MSIKALNWAFDLYFKTPSHKLVMLALADNATNEGLSYPFLKTIAMKACLKDIRHVQRIIRIFEEQGYLTREEHFKKGNKQTSNCYQLHLEKEFKTIHDLSTRVVCTPGEGWSVHQGGDGVETTRAPKKTPKNPKTNNIIQEQENHQPKLITLTNNQIHKNVVVIPDWLNKEDWEDFKKFRSEKGKPLSLTGEKRAIKKLEKLRKLGNDPSLVIDRTIDKNWDGLHPLIKQNNNNELRCTVKEWTKGNPDYDRVHGLSN